MSPSKKNPKAKAVVKVPPWREEFAVEVEELLAAELLAAE